MPTSLIGNDAFQEVDIVGITRSISKYAVMVRKREDLAETIRKAFSIAKAGKPGVVVVDMPKDVQKAYGSDRYQKEIFRRLPLGLPRITRLAVLSQALFGIFCLENEHICAILEMKFLSQGSHGGDSLKMSLLPDA